MCAPNKIKKRDKALSYTCFASHLVITISCCGVRPLGRHFKNGSFSSSYMNCMSIDSIIEVFYYHLNKMLIATKHIADSNFLSVKERNGTSCMQHIPNLSTSLFQTYDPNSPVVIGERH